MNTPNRIKFTDPATKETKQYMLCMLRVLIRDPLTDTPLEVSIIPVRKDGTFVFEEGAGEDEKIGVCKLVSAYLPTCVMEPQV